MNKPEFLSVSQLTQRVTAWTNSSSENCPGLSRSQAQKLIDDGYVIVNGLMEKANHKTEIGEKIEVTIRHPR